MKKYSQKEITDDIAFDIAVEHQWIEDGKWKSDEFRDKAYKLAELESEKFLKGGEAKAKNESFSEYYAGNGLLITDGSKYFF